MAQDEMREARAKKELLMEKTGMEALEAILLFIAGKATLQIEPNVLSSGHAVRFVRDPAP